MPQVASWKYTTTVSIFYSARGRHDILFKCFAPPVGLSKDELGRLKEIAGLSSSPVVPSSSDVFPVFPGDGDANSRSLVLQALYASNAVKRALLH